MSLHHGIGDIVRLRSGGPDMTVTAHIRQENCLCEWKNKNGYVQEGIFPHPCLDSIVKHQSVDKRQEISGELANALFSLLGALAEKLTGQTPTVCVRVDDKSDTIKVYPGTGMVTWKSVDSSANVAEAGSTESVKLGDNTYLFEDLWKGSWKTNPAAGLNVVGGGSGKIVVIVTGYDEKDEKAKEEAIKIAKSINVNCNVLVIPAILASPTT